MADSPGDQAAERSQQLLRRSRDLAARKAITQDDIDRAARHAQDAHERDEEAHRREQYWLYEAGATHERAAEIQELAVQEGLGDVDAHRQAAERERQAALRDLQAAQEFDRRHEE
jgi:hypothetical protein